MFSLLVHNAKMSPDVFDLAHKALSAAATRALKALRQQLSLIPRHVTAPAVCSPAAVF